MKHRGKDHGNRQGNRSDKRRVRRSDLLAGAAGTVLGLVLATAGPALARDPSVFPATGPTPEAPFIDRREIVVPARGAELVRIDNLLGRVGIRGTARPGEIHIVAEKRAGSAETLARLRVHYTAFESGEIQIDTRVELGGRERSLPLAGSGIDLWLEVPPDVAIEAKTFGGDVSASGLRAGAKLETTGGRIGVSDVRGGVVTHQLRGGRRWRRSRGTSISTAWKGTWTSRTSAVGASMRASSTGTSTPRTSATTSFAW